MDDVEKAIRKIRNGVFVITFFLGGKEYGVTSAWVNRVAFRPNTLMVSMGKKRRGCEELLESEAFCVNIMGEEHLEIARHFGASEGENLNNFKDLEFKEMESGSPVLRNCVAALDCKVVRKVDVGDHVVIFGEILNGVNNEGEGMVFRREDFPS